MTTVTSMPDITAISNLKGGSGKSTLAGNVAYSLMRQGYSTLLIDCDPQGNASMTLGKVPPLELKNTIGKVFSEGASFSELAQESKYKGVDIIPSNLSVVTDLLNLPPNSVRRTHAFVNALDEKTCNKYDHIILDCPPSIDGAPLVNAMVLCRYVVIPVDGFYALASVESLLGCIETIKIDAQKDISVLGIVATKQDARTNESKALRQGIITHFGTDSLFDTHIPQSVAIKESQIVGKALCDHNRKSPGCTAFNSFTSEMVERIEALKKAS